jgi:hypothetical protein
MTIQSSGSLNFTQIATEKGFVGSVGLSLGFLSLNNINTLNPATKVAANTSTASGNYPDAVAPHRISEFYAYDHAYIVPTTTTTTAAATTTTTTAAATTSTTTAAATTSTTTAAATTSTTTGAPTTTTSTTAEPTTTTTTAAPTTTSTTTAAPSYSSISTWGYGSGSSAGDACPSNTAQGVTELFVLNSAPIQNGTTVYYEDTPGVYLPLDGQGLYWAQAPFASAQDSYIISSVGVLSAEHTC